MTHRIILHTEQNPEDNAMLQALYSRSADSVLNHLERLKKIGSGKFMEQYYVGYGHNSIADCGFITIYLEGISMLAAKAIEDNPLFNGQESSSRYIDWSNQPFFNPYTGDESGQPDINAYANIRYKEAAEQLLTDMRKFYVNSIEPVKEHLRATFPKDDETTEGIYDKTITAKTFDILRGFLPCGALTNVAWTTSLRKAREHLVLLSKHPLLEVQNIARDTYRKLVEAYPHSFPAEMERADLPVEVQAYDLSYHNFYFEDPVHFDADYFIRKVDIPDVYKIEGHNSNVGKRPPRTAFHKHELAVRMTRYDVYSEIDFGSFRDLQRHRGGYCAMPLVDNAYGFHQWYYDQLPDAIKAEANDLMDKIADFIRLTVPEEGVDTSDEAAAALKARSYSAKLKNQYLLPMGNLVPTVLSYDLQQMAYVMELRTGQTVHPTLRAYMQDVYEDIERLSEKGTEMYPNMTPDEFSVKRGSQDIVKK